MSETRRIITSPTWWWWAGAATLAKLPGNMVPLAFLLALPGVEGALGAAGYTVGVGLGAGWRGRAIDRAGPRTGLRRETLFLAAMAGTVALVLATRLPLPVVLLSAVGLGVAGSAVGTAYRAALPTIVAKEALPRTYTVDAVLTEISFVASPMIAGGLITLTSREVVFGAAAVFAIGAFFATGALPPSRSAYTERSGPRLQWLRAAAPVYVITGAIGLGYGLLMAGVTERTAELGWPEAATTGVFSIMSAASAVAGLVVILRGGALGRRNVVRTVSLLSIPFAVATSAMVLVTHTPAIPIAMAIFGASLAPLSGISTTVLTTRVERGAHARALAFAAAMITIPSGVGFALAALLLWLSGSTSVLAASAVVYVALAVALVVAAARRTSERGDRNQEPDTR